VSTRGVQRFGPTRQPAKTNPTRRFGLVWFGLAGWFGLKIPSPQWFGLGCGFQNSEPAQPNPTRQPATYVFFIFLF